MRFKEILNLNERGLRMGQRDLSSTPLNNLTIDTCAGTFQSGLPTEEFNDWFNKNIFMVD